MELALIEMGKILSYGNKLSTDVSLIIGTILKIIFKAIFMAISASTRPKEVSAG
jgi:hypothetical protein